MFNFLDKARYYIWASYRRRLLDKLQKKYSNLYKGIVLDIGGRNRGGFKKPKEKVEQWIFADIEESHNPDIVLDVSCMNMVETESIDIIAAMELFEHVEKIEKGLSECYRVLKKGGFMLISVPFLHPIHADPSDFQRWTEYKWRVELERIGFKIKKIILWGHILLSWQTC